VFAYGQTGCGKSFTMQGIKDNQSQKGIIPRAFEHIFEAVSIDTSKKYLIRASYLEIYNENVRDLLGKEYKSTLEMHVIKIIMIIINYDYNNLNIPQIHKLKRKVQKKEFM
jgi:hypothetical protein